MILSLRAHNLCLNCPISQNHFLFAYAYIIVTACFYVRRWVSGVSSVYHPVVWMACAMYSKSTALMDRVWGEGRNCLVLVYLQGSTIPQFSQCVLKNCGKLAELASGESSLSVSGSILQPF